ncbi:MAG TPA: hypothetical protein VHA33_09840 [Candidatus Angelobacter sp.]|nr:hypothetical protein [Candidatus Angelobacter sp.]
MTGVIHPRDTSGLAQAYSSLLREYVAGAGEIALKRAYDLGRRASAKALASWS